ncbi:MAG TPA: hypothetical protein VMV47_18580 [Bacteroidales bacterium]|nr:hypothetical protein [Bacteroidales bacterium]
MRLKIGLIILRKRLSKISHKSRYKNFMEVRNIGIVWDASKHQEFQSLARFHQKMLEKNIEVKIIGFHKGKHLPDQYTAIRYLRCIKSSETNIFYIPFSSEVQSFTDFKFDVLVDINFDKLFTLMYITKLSKATLKVGLFDPEENNTPFDLMMEIKKPVNVEEYLKQVIQYLEMINS